MKNKLLIILLCFIILIGITGCGEKKKNTEIKNYLESIGYICKDYEDSKYSCSLEDNNVVNYFIISKSEEDKAEIFTEYERTWSNGSIFKTRVNSYLNEYPTTYKEFNTGILLTFDDTKINTNLNCDFYEEHYKGEDKLSLCREDIDAINEAKNYFEDIMSKVNVSLTKK